jgi:ABC-type nitrate/sulfonate/bicarbonate transport system substrate-binding protein
MSAKYGLERRQVLKLAAGGVAGLALSPQAIAQAPKGGPLKPVTIATTAGNTGAAFIELMKRKGFFEEYGLEAKWLSVSDGAKVVTAVLTGEVDLVRASGFGQVLAAVNKGGKLKVVSGASVLITQAIYSSKPEVKSLKDLEGRTVGTGAPGALLHHMTVSTSQEERRRPRQGQFRQRGFQRRRLQGRGCRHGRRWPEPERHS